MQALIAEEHGVSHEGGRLYAKCWTPAAAHHAKRTPIVLLHDSLGCVALWRDFPAALAEATGRMVVAYDRPGFGQSDAQASPLPLSFIGDEARGGFQSVVDHFEFDRFVVFGHSVGGGMAVGCAAAFSDRCDALITESAQAFVEDRTVQGIRAAQDVFQQPGQIDRLRKYHGDKAEWVLHAWTDTWLADDFATWSLDATLARVTCPNLVIHGDLDEYGSVRHPERMAHLTRGASTLKILEGIGHVPHREQPARTLELVKAWLAAI
ncbi:MULTISPECIES: alpha/beta fold hydrolase [Dyella]|uniref:Alpha/beta hydrolase n=2 Tax=Dyella TaxID=231454 RepID=A0A4R0YE15_9GAMM|nr:MULTISPECIES: alpha/beta hydrolase [Dyella]TBR36164.1 alpha/beta hydrolase [Dyella terrae]TCI06213.1 alpha/beta hydrolase [Dyella soli]